MRNILLFKACRALTERQCPDGYPAQIVVHVAGEVDVATSSILADAVARAMGTAADRVDLVVDLAQVRFIDASGINVLLNAGRQARAGGGTLVLRSPSRAVRRLLDVLHLDEVLAVESPPAGSASPPPIPADHPVRERARLTVSRARSS